MGTTLVALLISGEHGALANVGDSRAYLLRPPGGLCQITEDHTYGHLVADAASVANLPERLSRFLDGRLDGRSPDITMWKLQPGDRFLLCSDGLSSFVPHAEIQDVLTSSPTAEDAADRLIQLGLGYGGKDNITVVVADVQEDKF
jgi:protein phosphatase